MQIIFAFTFLISIFVVTAIGLMPSDRRAEEVNGAYAQQMSTWHRAAITRCVQATCTTGAVDPTARLPLVARNQAIYGSGGFVTRYDAPSKTLVTYANPRSLGPLATAGGIVAGLRRAFGDESSSFGSYDRSTLSVRGNYVRGLLATALVKLPAAAVGGTTIPDGSAVIVSKL